jgi:hypothetical protein
MQTFNIDDLVPDYRPAFKLPKRATKAEKLMAERSQRIYTAHPYNRPASSYPGVKPEVILNWRALERRMSEINEMWKIANGDWILRFEGGGISHDDPVRLADEMIAGKRNSEKMTIIKYEEGGREIGRMEHRANRLHRMFGVYERILHRAIHDRLQVHLGRIRDSMEITTVHSYYYPPTVYIIENEGRMMIAQSDSMGRLSWINGDVMISREGGNDERAKIAA